MLLFFAISWTKNRLQTICFNSCYNDGTATLRDQTSFNKETFLLHPSHIKLICGLCRRPRCRWCPIFSFCFLLGGLRNQLARDHRGLKTTLVSTIQFHRNIGLPDPLPEASPVTATYFRESAAARATVS